MRTFITGSMMLALAAMTFGCCETSKQVDTSTKPMSSSTPAPANPTSGTKACTLQSGGHDVLRLMVKDDAKCVNKDGMVDLTSHDLGVEIWLAKDATTVDEAIGQLGRVISDEFKNLKPDTTTDLNVAGSPAKRIMGSGNEADDGDPGHADVIVFKTGDHVFIALAHGEYLPPAASQWLLTVVQTAQVP